MLVFTHPVHLGRTEPYNRIRDGIKWCACGTLHEADGVQLAYGPPVVKTVDITQFSNTNI